MTPPRTYPHWVAVATIASVAILFGGGFSATQSALRAGFPVGAVLSLRFVLAAIGLSVLLLVRRQPLPRRAVLDGIILGLLLATLCWLLADGLRFTTTSKSGFITSLYVPLTPLLAILLGDRVKPGHAIAAVLATLGLFLLVHLPGGPLSGWNRGDFEILLCAVLCAGHLIATAHFSRRSSGWVLAWMQIVVTGGVSAVITAFLPAPNGFHGVAAALNNRTGLAAIAYLVVYTMYAFWAQSTMQAFLSSTEAAVIFSLEPVTAGVVGVYLIGEKLYPLQLVGAALIIAATISAEVLPRMIRTRAEIEPRFMKQARVAATAEKPADQIAK
ncbi:MAG TPA: DMT family transporter [Candidatus Angelobacter sp.]|nr:DMT family transporter [Candidatus Angelobacter sp.]